MIKPSLGITLSAFAVATSFGADPASNGPAPPSKVLAATNSPDLWNWHAQNTVTAQGYPGFSSKYSGLNSLPSGGEGRESVSLDLMAGVHLWDGAEAHADGLMWQGFGLNNTLGVEGFPNGEAFRIGTEVPNGAITRLFIRQTIGLGGAQEEVPDDELNLAGTRDISRLTLTLGRFSAGDIFDQNAYANDARRQFMNWAFVNNEGWDYPADAIGFTTGLAMEWNHPDWTLRFGFFQVPRVQNTLTAEDRVLKWPYDPAVDGPSQDGAFLQAWAMVTEWEQRYSLNTHPGTIRLLAYLNRADMAEYSQATSLLDEGKSFLSARAYRYKYGFGLNWEQEIARNVGVFSRLGWNDDHEEGWLFSDVGHTASLGLSIKGEPWHRPEDTVGLAGAANGISKSAQNFFAAGGTGILAGDGGLNYGWEKIIETYYDFKIWETMHGSLDYQFISDPAFNQDRGPVSVFGGRIHWEF